jgi:hypothetical protein
MKKSSIFLLVLLSTLLLGCAAIPDAEVTNPPLEIERNLFTHLPGENNQILAVKIDDSSSARPQQGLEDADVIYVTEVEAGITRLLAIYSSRYPEVIGPIRSARISDIDILANYGNVGFAYSGAQGKFRPLLAQANLTNLSAERNPPSIYFSDKNRRSPYSMMLNTAPLIAKAPELAKPVAMGWVHGKRSATAKKFDLVTISWPGAKYQASWNKAESRFHLSFNGKDNLSTTGEILGSPMMVIQIVQISPSRFGDRFGGVTPKSETIGAGDGYLLRNGRAIKVGWERLSKAGPTRWFTADGQEARFAEGQIWIFLTSKEPIFTWSESKKDPS